MPHTMTNKSKVEVKVPVSCVRAMPYAMTRKLQLLTLVYVHVPFQLTYLEYSMCLLALVLLVPTSTSSIMISHISFIVLVSFVFSASENNLLVIITNENVDTGWGFSLLVYKIN